MIQSKKIASKSVIVLLIFLTTTTYGFLPNVHPDTSRSANQRDRISFDRSQLVDRNLPGNRNLVRQIHQKDRVYENLYDRRSFRTGTPDERRLSRDIDNNRITNSRQARFSLDEPRNIRVGVDNRQRSSDFRNQNMESRSRNIDVGRVIIDKRLDQRYASRNIFERRDERHTRNTMGSSRNYNFRADLSRSDSIRQSRNARANFERVSGGSQSIRSTSGNLRFRENSERADSTRYLNSNRDNIAQERRSGTRQRRNISEYRRNADPTRYLEDAPRNLERETASRQDNSRVETRRNYGRMSHGRQLEQENDRQNSRRTALVENSREFAARNSFDANVRQRNSYRSSTIRDGRINVNSPRVGAIETLADPKTCSKTSRYIIPQRRVSALNATRMWRDLDLGSKPIHPFDPMRLNQTLSDNSWVNVAQTILAIYMIWQILASSSQKSRFRFQNMLSAKEKLH